MEELPMSFLWPLRKRKPTDHILNQQEGTKLSLKTMAGLMLMISKSQDQESTFVCNELITFLPFLETV
jgi:hypothetical protein